jgi:hypothetical protein
MDDQDIDDWLRLAEDIARRAKYSAARRLFGHPDCW